jgi:hypothetical protein
MTDIEVQAREIPDALLALAFPEGTPIATSFADRTTNPGIYAVRHHTDGLLDVGKTQDFKERCKGGHKALTWAWIEDSDHRDTRLPPPKTLPQFGTMALLSPDRRVARGGRRSRRLQGQSWNHNLTQGRFIRQKKFLKPAFSR